MPTINLTDAELAAVTAAVRRTIGDNKFPHAPRLVPMRTALMKFDDAPKPPPEPRTPPPAGKRARREKHA
jgi:hypothetical protein